MPDGGRPIVNPTLRVTALADISRRGKGRRRIEVTDPRTLRLLLATAAGGGRPRLDRGLARRLLREGILVRPAEVPGEVDLDPRLGPTGLPRTPAAAGEAGGRLRAGCRLSRGPGLPAAIARRLGSVEPFLPAEDILWVRHPGSGMQLPYTLTPEVERAVRRLRRGRATLPGSITSVLRAVGAVGAPGDVARERAAWQRRVRGWRRALRASGHAVLRDLFTPIVVTAVRAYCRRLEREGYLLGGDARRRGRPVVHDEPLLAFLGAQLAAVVRQVTRERASSTFSFLRIYDPGAALAPHRDNPVARWNIDLVVGGEPPPSRRTAWPFWIAARPGRRAVRLGLGDAVLYRGTHLTHWRAAQPAGRSTVLACFHYGPGNSG